MHELGPEPNFNESMYFNFYDPGVGLGGFFRLGNRANEGTGEMTICLYLPDGRVAFMFRRPRVTTNDAFDAAGCVRRPRALRPLQVRYEGTAVILDDPLEMADPRQAFTANPHVRCAVDLAYGGSAMFGGEPDTPSNGRARNSPAATTSSWCGRGLGAGGRRRLGAPRVRPP